MSDDRQAGAEVLKVALELHPRVAIRPEAFGALMYHYDNRRLMFVKHHDVVRVVNSLSEYRDVGEALVGCGIEAGRHGQFAQTLQALLESEVLRVRDI